MRSKHTLKLGIASILFIIATLIFLIPRFQVNAQIASETIELAGGESKIITVNFPVNEYEHYHDIGVFHKGGGDLGGFVVSARARGLFSRNNCQVKLAVIAGVSNELVFHHSNSWSDWVSVSIPSGTNAAVVSISAMEYQGGGIGCGDGSMEVEISLEGQETITKTPTLTRTPVTITVTKTLPPPNPSKPIDSQATFWADAYTLERGQCTTIHWDVTNATVYWNNATANNSAKVEGICPEQTTSYILGVWGRDGLWHDQSLTITIEEPPTVSTPLPTQQPECDPTEKVGTILIITDSRNLANSTGDPQSWEKVKNALQQYYESGMVNCEGKPIFLDMSIPYPQGGYTISEIRQAIASEMIRWKFEINGTNLAAIAIIGGPDVIPMPQLPDYTGLEELIATDDVYADLDYDLLNTADTVITRLPDGHSTDLLLNYINALASGVEPPEGGVVLAPLQYSSHRLNFGPDYAEGIFSNNDDLLYLDDLLNDKAGSVSYLISPVWSTWDYNPSAVDQKLIRVDDLINSMGSDAENSSVGTMLNKRDILIHNLDSGDDYTSVWYARNAAPNSTHITAYDFQEARSIPAGAHVFALVPHSADLSTGDQQAYYHIPLAMLNSGAHHYIGLTGKLLIAVKNSRPYNGDPDAFVDINIARYSGAFAQYYYRSSYEDPATSFWSAKNTYEREQGLSTPYDYKTYHSFIYYGLPEKGPSLGIYQSGSLVPLPEPVYNPLKPLKSCPSGDSNNCDGDTLPDSLEHYLVETFKPYLIFDENENVWEGSNPFAVYWQVSPAKFDGRKGAFITLVMTYPQDWGIHDIDINGFAGVGVCNLTPIYGPVVGAVEGCFTDPSEWWKNPLGKVLKCGGKIITGVAGGFIIDVAAWLGEVVNINPGTVFLGHAGDTEAIRLFVAEPGSAPLPPGSITDINSNWSLTHIDWKRHEERFGTPKTIEKMMQEGMTINDTHPIVFVSENKHAMYPDYGMCEASIWDMGEFTPLKGCTVKFEDCGGPDLVGARFDIEFIPYTPPTHNVGEEEQVTRFGELEPVIVPPFHMLEELSPDFACEYAWSQEPFCGGLRGEGCDPLIASGGLMDELCAGGLGKMWYGPSNDPYNNR